MAKIKVYGRTDISVALKKKFIEAIDRKLLTQIADFIVNRIQSFTRSGKTLAYGPKPENLKRLSDSYLDVRRGAIHFRKRKGSKGEKAFVIEGPDPRLQDVDPEFFDPNLSQLTFTGQLTRSLKHSIDAGSLTIKISPEGKRREGKGLTNKQVAEYVANQGRKFLGIDDAGVKNIVRQIKASIRRSFKK